MLRRAWALKKNGPTWKTFSTGVPGKNSPRSIKIPRQISTPLAAKDLTSKQVTALAFRSNVGSALPISKRTYCPKQPGTARFSVDGFFLGGFFQSVPRVGIPAFNPQAFAKVGASPEGSNCIKGPKAAETPPKWTWWKKWRKAHMLGWVKHQRSRIPKILN